MIHLHGYAWPDDVGDRHAHALMHVQSLEVGLRFCAQRRTAVQAGGNIGLWPKRLSEVFTRVFTFEPDAESRACLLQNVAANVIVSPAALGRADGACGLKHKGLGSHRVIDGATIAVTTVDGLGLEDLDFLQLDVEGYEMAALEGALETIERCRPVIQLELRNFTEKFGSSDAAVRALLSSRGYHQVARAQGSDFVFQWRAA
jgi:FkbM family methyltransferase